MGIGRTGTGGRAAGPLVVVPVATSLLAMVGGAYVAGRLTLAAAYIGIVGVLAAGSCLAGAVRAREGVRLGWLCLALAILAWVFALSVARQWPDYQGLWFGARLVGLSAVGIGLAWAPGVRRPPREWSLLLLDGWMVASSVLVTYLAVAVSPAAAAAGIVPQARLPIILLAGDLIAVSVLFGLARRTSRADVVPVVGLVIAGVLGTAADVTHLLALPTSGLPAPTLALWAGSIAVLGVAPWIGRLDVFASAAPGGGRVRIGRLAHVAVAAATLVGVGAVARGRPLDVVFAVLGITSIAAVVAQMFVLEQENRSLYDSLVAQTDRFRALLQGSSDVIVTCSIDGRVTYVSPAVEVVFGYPPEVFAQGSLLDVVHPEDLPEVADRLRTMLDSHESGVRLRARLRHAGGSWRHTESTVSPFGPPGRPSGLILNARDVTDRVALEDELHRRAARDDLTGLLNRPAFAEELARWLVDPDASRDLAVLFVDLDDFKSVNDAAGHATGDALLVEVARRLEDAVRAEDVVARFGGDEFVALVSVPESEDVMTVAERLRGALSGPYVLDGGEVVTRASVGVAVVAPGDTAEDVLRNADLAMYRAKGAGRDRSAVYVPEMHAEAVERVDLSAQLRHAVEAEQLTLHYQPIVDLSDGRVVRVEALLRWRLPDGTDVPPARFVPVAEESGLIAPLGCWVLRTALDQLQAWRASGLDVAIAVNLSARQLERADVVSDVAAALAASEAPASALMLEITENVLLGNLARSSERLRELRALGVTIALDDFGTGFSSLGYLSELPVDVLKVDRSFVVALGAGCASAALVRAMVNLATDLGLGTVAEGVETPGQLAALQSLGYEHAQGYLLARPMPADQIDALVRSGFGELVSGLALVV